MLKLPFQKLLKTIFTFFLFLSLFGLFPHCSLTGPEEKKCYNQKQTVFHPDVVGSWWKYQMWQGDMGRIDDTLILSITNNINIIYENNTYTTHTVKNNYQSDDIHYLKWNGPDGWYSMGAISNADTLLLKALDFKYPVSPGDSWEVPIISTYWDNTFYIHDTLKFTCIDTNIRVITEIDTFKTILYAHEIPGQLDTPFSEIGYHYFTPGIGMIMYELKNKGYDRVKGRILLFDYCLNK